jgi:repressor LexA
MAAITQAQSRVLEFIKDFIKTNRYSPTFQEIAIGCGLKSLATVSKHIQHLVAKGVLTQNRNLKRSIEIVEPPTKQRFELIGTERLWDSVEMCYWVRER